MSSAYIYSILATAAIFTLLALSLNIITGYAGQAMMGIAAFFGIGAYTAAIITTNGGNFFLALLAGMAVSGICGALLGVISLRLQADFLAITTIGINFVMVALFNRLKITGGTLGLTIAKPVVFGAKMNNRYFFYLTVVLIVILCLLLVKMRNSWFGMALASINNDPGAARSFGINVNRYQILAFTIGTSIAGLAGGIYAHRMGFISATDFAFVVSIQVVSMVVIGGLGTLRGPIFGALLITSLPEILRFADDYRELVYGGVEVPFLPAIYPNAIYCYSYSKTLSLPGERVGFLALHPAMDDYAAVHAAVLGAGRALGYICVSSLFQLAVAECLGQTADISAYAANRELIYGALADMGYACARPDGAFYLFLKSPEPDARAFCRRAMDYDILLVPGDDFGCPGYARLAYCVARSQLERSLPAFRKLAESYGLSK